MKNRRGRKKWRGRHVKVSPLIINVRYSASNVVNIRTRNTLDCDQSNYSSRIVFSHIPIAFVQTVISAIRAAILDLAKPEIAPFDPPTSKSPT